MGGSGKRGMCGWEALSVPVERRSSSPSIRSELFGNAGQSGADVCVWPRVGRCMYVPWPDVEDIGSRITPDVVA